MLERFRAILRIAELDTQQRRSGFAHIDLTSVIGPVADLYEPVAEAAGIRLLTTCEPGCEVDADQKLLFEAVSNLVDNAIKFGGRGGTVQVRRGKDPRSSPNHCSR